MQALYQDIAEGRQTEIGLLDAVCQTFNCTPNEARKINAKDAISIMERRMAMRAKELIHIDPGLSQKARDIALKKLQQHPDLVKLWREITDSVR